MRNSTILVGAPAGGLSAYRNLDAQIAGSVVKGTPGMVYGWQIHNRAAAVRHVKLYAKATAPSGADAPLLTISVPAAWESVVTVPQGIAFANGISLRGTTLVADADATAPTANDVVVNLFYV